MFTQSVLTYLTAMTAMATESKIAFCIIFFGYMFQTMVLQYVFYFRQSKNVFDWKIQHDKIQHVNVLYGLPLISTKPNRAPNHGKIAFLNLLMASMFACFTTECCVKRLNRMQFGAVVDHGLSQILIEFVVAVIYQSVAEYYWHRLMHLKAFYARFHKHHHFYKSPEPWDDMYIHPVEAFGYYCILYGPPFLFSMHYSAFIAYMVLMGLCGVLDHSGVRVSIPGLYNTVDHDNHHARFEVNYAFPFPFMDLLHGTFEGEFLGAQYTRAKRK